MKITIIETGHFQYALTQAEIFSEAEITIITTDQAKKDMLDYFPDSIKYKYILITSITKDEKRIIDHFEQEKVDLLLISPVFDSYSALNRIVKRIKNCKKVLTTHNINTWFNGRFWSPRSYLDRTNMLSIINNCDFIAVEDFIYNHLKSTNHPYFLKHNFLYIPFTIFHESKRRKYVKENDTFKVVLTGAIDGDRRRYEDIIEVIHFFSTTNFNITFSFAGRAKGEYGLRIQQQLQTIKSSSPLLVSYFDNHSTVDMFRYEMETSDIVLSTSTKTFKGMGTVEHIGKTKPTAAIHDMMTYELPGLLPSHLNVPQNLKGSVFNYQSTEDLKKILVNLLDNPTLLTQWKAKAKENSLNFTAREIRKGLPF